MEPVRIAVDIQALQEGSGATSRRRRLVAGWAAALARSGRLAAAVLAPELGPLSPGLLPRELDGGPVLWDSRAELRRLLAAHPRLVRLVPAPLLHCDPSSPAGLVVAQHWAEAAVPRVVVVDDEDRATPSSARVDARFGWIRSSDVVLDDGDDADTPDQGRADHLRRAGADLLRRAGADRGADHPGPPDRDVADLLARLDARPTVAVDLPVRMAIFGPFPPGGGGIGAYNARLVEALAATPGPGGRVLRVDAVPITAGWDSPPGVGRIHPDSFGTDVRPASYDAVVYTLGNSEGHLASVAAALRHPGLLWLHEARLPAVTTTALAELDDDEFRRRVDRLLERAYPGRPPLAAARRAGRDHLALAAAGVGLLGPLAERSAGLLVNSSAARHAVLLDLPPLAWSLPVGVLPPACPPLRPRSAESVEDDLVVALGVVSMGKRPDLLVAAAARAGCRLAFVGPCPDILREVIANRAEASGNAVRVTVTGTVDDPSWWEWMGRAALAVQLRDTATGEMSAAVLDALAVGVPVVTNLASTRDYPAGTVHLLESTDCEALASVLSGLLADRRRRADLSLAGLDFAARHQMDGLATSLVDQVLAADASR